jgi:cytochrome c peroxidase
MLYYETRLSKNHDTSCNSCHDLENFGVDIREVGGKRTKTSEGHKKAFGARNSPTVYNAAFHLAQFWDGRAADVEEQAKGPILNPVEMAMADHGAVMTTVASIPGYVEMFKAAFPGEAAPVTIDNLGKAIGAFERGLVTPGPFDKFLQGDTSVLSPPALRGIQLFVDAQCVTCHSGPGVGGTQYQKIGNLKDYPTKDLGRFKVTKDERDRKLFKVPLLRNIAKTAPYFHDGSKKTLTDAINTMAEYQTVKGSFTDEERADLIAFLEALTGKIDPNYIKMPALPASGPTTPAPDPS